MIERMLGPQERALIAAEVKQFFLHPRSLHFVPLTLAGLMLVLWPYFTSPFVAVVVTVLAGMEPQINNILFRTPREFESMNLFPVRWDRVVMAKNIATLLLLGVLFPPVSATLLYFSPSAPTFQQTQEAVLYVLTVIFPLLHIGNMRSVQNPRRICGWQVDDLAGMIELLISLAVLSIPFLLFDDVLHAPVLSLVYFIGTTAFWFRYSICKTARFIQLRKTELCLTV